MKMIMAYEGSEKYRKRISYLNTLNKQNFNKFKLKVITDKFLECKVAVFYRVK